MKRVEELALEEGFGRLAKTATPTFNPNGKKNKTIQTYKFTQLQAIAVGARLNNKMLMKVVRLWLLGGSKVVMLIFITLL